MELSLGKALISIQTFHKQQQALFDEFVLLRQKYDDQKDGLLNILWIKCSQYHPELRQIPKVEDEETFVETEENIGPYAVGDILGEGQFATVKLCWKEEAPDELFALKMIKKERVTTFALLRRVSNEIEILRRLDSPFVVSVKNVIQTSTMLYIVTEKGGSDLFEFFDEHPDGVPEAWAKDIIICILRAVSYCHDQGVCHRDLKPENILLSFDNANKKCIDLKLCDFGLSTVFSPDVELSDFCGSPGFFSPEMIIKGSYFGDKADVWSIGCILLELILGHERFCDVWMSAYDYEILQDKEKFTREIEQTLIRLPDALTFSSELNDFVSRFLRLRSSERPSTKKICVHPWLGGAFTNDVSFASKLALREDCGQAPRSPGVVRDHKMGLHLQSEVLNIEVDGRTRHMIEAENEKGHSHFHLPPIEPQTPSVVRARKLLNPPVDVMSFSPNGDLAKKIVHSPLVTVSEMDGMEAASAKVKMGAELQSSASESAIHRK